MSQCFREVPALSWLVRTPLGEVPVHGRLSEDSARPVLLVMRGLFSGALGLA